MWVSWSAAGSLHFHIFDQLYKISILLCSNGTATKAATGSTSKSRKSSSPVLSLISLGLADEKFSQVVSACIISQLLHNLWALQHTIPARWNHKTNNSRVQQMLKDLQNAKITRLQEVPRHALLAADLQHPLCEHPQLGHLTAARFQPPGWQHLWKLGVLQLVMLTKKIVRSAWVD